jgi:hypothetical protein
VTEFAILDGVVVQNMAIDKDAALANVAHALNLGLPELDWLPECGKSKGGEPIAIVAAGPSLRYTLAELAGFRTIMVAGSAHDFAVSRGVKPTYAIVVDPTPGVVASYIRRPIPTCNYLIASQCDPGLFSHLSGYPVTVWHCDGTINGHGERLLASRLPPGTGTIEAGGCTVGLRAIAVANALGYYEQHLFGFDSCIDPNTEQTHAFPLNDPTVEFVNCNGGQVQTIRICRPGADAESGRKFRIPNYLMSQAWEFERLLKNSKGSVNFTIHGDGVFAEMLHLYRQANGRG